MVLLTVFSLRDAEAKPIRLRNETLSPDNAEQERRSSNRTSTSSDGTATSGLFLIQFNGATQSTWRRQLRAQGVELLRYVPDDAYVARFENARPNQVRNLSFVRWIGEYKPTDKIHPHLRSGRTNAPNETLDVAVLLSPRASDADVSKTKRSLLSIRQESAYRFGHILRGRLTRSQLETLAQSDSVLWIESAPKMKLFDEVSSKIVAGDGGPNMLLSQQRGFSGSGVTVAVADTGVDSVLRPSLPIAAIL